MGRSARAPAGAGLGGRTAAAAAGTATGAAGEAVVSGGRVLCVTALADTVAAARQKAYGVVEGIRFDGMQFRRDIGYRAL